MRLIDYDLISVLADDARLNLGKSVPALAASGLKVSQAAVDHGSGLHSNVM
jgi:hypothetical protein